MIFPLAQSMYRVLLTSLALFVLRMPGSVHAQEHPPILIVTIRDAQGTGVAGITILVRDYSGQHAFARSLTNAQGVAIITSVPTMDVRVAVQGNLPNGMALTQPGADAVGVAMTLDLPPNQLDLRIEPDGRVIPDPTTMVTLDPGIVSVPASIPTAVIAAPVGSVPTASRVFPALTPAMNPVVPVTLDTPRAPHVWLFLGIALLFIGVVVVVFTLGRRRRAGSEG